MGRWREALRELEAFHALTGSFDQHPAMMDCQRALGRHGEVERLWEELGDASPGADLVTEGRIVRAGSMADRGDIAGAARLLESAARKVDRPREHHLRLWYALADLYERAGELPKAREIFGRILRHDRSFFDTAERQAGLG
jgi:tetratricopeptide (TPR) repeat protein